MVSRDRGQLLIVSALVIAVILVAIVLVLNGTMYVENVDGGSRGGAAAADAGAVRESIGQDLQRLTAFTADGEGYADTTRLTDETNALSGNYSRFAAGGGPASVSLSLNESASTRVTRITDDGAGSRPPNDDHVLVTTSEAREHDVRVVDFDVNFTVGSELDWSTSREFTIRVTDASTSNGGRDARWVLRINRANDGSGQARFTTSGPSTCGREAVSDGDRVRIDVDDGVIEHADGTPICTFEFGAGVSAPYGITIEDRGRIGDGSDHGTYDLVLNEYVPDVETRLAGPFPDVFNATRSATYDFDYEASGLDYDTRVSAPVPRHRVPLLVEDFEDGWDGAWQHDGTGDSGVRTDATSRGTVAHSGVNATYLENTSTNPSNDNLLQYDRSLDTSSYDAVTVSFWTQQGDTADGNVDNADEDLVVEYWDGATWQRIGAVSYSGPATEAHGFRLTDPAARHSEFKIRFRQAESSATDPWYIDDVVVQGVNES